ncbi:hypothetical protein [Streptomyces sp. TRM70350]|uniref:hypothetical protein n=1 Tax=Streptomyces sp. TRM70350 TaxID=2856165 RepID=UPI001C44744A|nr:hypothetical protein [Streptomyces sp. TRM70350]MBV7697305.1 hypothetical protein [Streptomyces sp. TRM70350]
MTATDDAPLTDRRRAVVTDAYDTPPLAPILGEGSTVRDEPGRAHTPLGHAHPAVVSAVSARSARGGPESAGARRSGDHQRERRRERGQRPTPVPVAA